MKKEDETQRLLVKAARLRRQIQQRLGNKTLPAPEEVIAKAREDRSEELLTSFQQMAQDEAREAAALEWAEATIGDVEGKAEADLF